MKGSETSGQIVNLEQPNDRPKGTVVMGLGEAEEWLLSEAIQYHSLQLLALTLRAVPANVEPYVHIYISKFCMRYLCKSQTVAPIIPITALHTDSHHLVVA